MAENSLGAYLSAPAAVAVLTAASAAFFSASGGEAQAKVSRLTAASSGTTTRTCESFIARSPPLALGEGAGHPAREHTPTWAARHPRGASLRLPLFLGGHPRPASCGP